MLEPLTVVTGLKGVTAEVNLTGLCYRTLTATQSVQDLFFSLSDCQNPTYFRDLGSIIFLEKEEMLFKNQGQQVW